MRWIEFCKRASMSSMTRWWRARPNARYGVLPSVERGGGYLSYSAIPSYGVAFMVVAMLLHLLTIHMETVLLAMVVVKKVGQEVFCDTCVVGFVTRVSKPIQGAKVVVQCKHHVGKHLYYTKGTTNFQGYFSIPMNGDHSHEKCEAKAISSPTSCNNGVVSCERAIGIFNFKSIEILVVCTSVMQEYAIYDLED
eukprot:Gb_28992 [translate_table: standard]